VSDPGYYQPPPYYEPPRTAGEATAALVLGVCGLIVCPFFCSIPAVVLGYSARRDIANSQGRLTGRGMAVAGIILGWIGIVLSVLGAAAIVLAAILDSS
jgi:hypothetical protein